MRERDLRNETPVWKPPSRRQRNSGVNWKPPSIAGTKTGKLRRSPEQRRERWGRTPEQRRERWGRSPEQRRERWGRSPEQRRVKLRSVNGRDGVDRRKKEKDGTQLTVFFSSKC
ncbi:hypothetical protein LXL04_036141 [Taraxacum kok-saghyz]